MQLVLVLDDGEEIELGVRFDLHTFDPDEDLDQLREAIETFLEEERNERG